MEKNTVSPRAAAAATSTSNAVSQITPSPTFDRAENLARLKDTTAKLLRGVTPPPLFTHQIPEKKSEIVEPPASFQRQIRVDSQVAGATAETTSSNLVEASDDVEAKSNKTYMRKEPISIPERLGPDMEECQAEQKNKETDETPKADLSNLDKEKADILGKEMPTFDIQAFKNVFEVTEQSSAFREEEKDLEELMSSLSEATADTSKQESPWETKGGSRQSTPLPLQENEKVTAEAQPLPFSETKSVTESFSEVDEFGNMVTGRMTSVTGHSESVSTTVTPFSYADAVKKKAARRTQTYDDDATEKLLKNFHKTWTESETVFKSLGYTVSEETSSHVVSHQTFSSGKNTCTA
uniref:Uncharacterized protein n=1 Tax=Oryzias sinensis TaxID=183150 RepID=A0A8C7ZRH0_9TELE